MKINLKENISPAFKEVWKDILQHKHTHYMLKGGRGSTKSSAISSFIPLLIMLNPDTHAVIVRKVGATLKDSVYNQMIWSINKLGVAHLFKIYKAPMKLVYEPTGQEIKFMGCDDPTKAKGTTVPFGRVAIVWFN